LLTVFLAARIVTYNTQAKLLQAETELSRLEVQSLNQQLEAERILASRQIANLKAQPALEPFTFVNLAPPESNLTKPIATIAWKRSTLAGVFISDQLSPPAADEEYRLWIEDASGRSVSAGTIKVGPAGTAQAQFQAGQPVDKVMRITLTRERISSVGQRSGPIVLTGSP
jgi:hypothetical protein